MTLCTAAAAAVAAVLSCAVGCVAQSSFYLTNCGDFSGCGTVCGGGDPGNIAAPSEGTFGTSCQCGPSGLCYYGGCSYPYCCDGPPPCSTSCFTQICIQVNSLKAPATIQSACPKYHPDNVAACCKNGGDYCTCMDQPTLDLENTPYWAIGGANAWTTGVWVGACGSELASLKIDGERAQKLLEPFMAPTDVCKAVGTNFTVAELAHCGAIDDATSCNADRACTRCASRSGRVASKCYDVQEAEVLLHVLAVEEGEGAFTCDKAPLFRDLIRATVEAAAAAVAH